MYVHFQHLRWYHLPRSANHGVQLDITLFKYALLFIRVCLPTSNYSMSFVFVFDLLLSVWALLQILVWQFSPFWHVANCLVCFPGVKTKQQQSRLNWTILNSFSEEASLNHDFLFWTLKAPAVLLIPVLASLVPFNFYHLFIVSQQKLALYPHEKCSLI